MASRNYRDLFVCQRAMELATEVYRVTADFPATERYGLTSQMRNCAVSIPSNIAEGQGRNSSKDFLRFVSIANGSRCELETQVLLAFRLNYLDDATRGILLERSEEVGRLLSGLSNSLR